MAREIKRARQARFIEAGLWNLTGCDTPALGKCLPKAPQEVYAALCSLAKKANLREMEVLTSAFDGLDLDGGTLHVEDVNHRSNIWEYCEMPKPRHRRYETTCFTDRFGQCDVVVVAEEITVSNARGKIADGYWGPCGLQDFFGAGQFEDQESAFGESWRKLQDATENAICAAMAGC